MIEWIFMIFDLIALVSLSLAHFNSVVAWGPVLFSAVYLIGKFLIFKDFMSFIDLLAGIYLLLVAVFGISTFLYYIFLGWFLYKLMFTIIKF